MPSEVARLDLRLRRRSMIGYMLGMALYTIVVVAMYPAFKNDTSLEQFTKASSTVAALFGVSGSLTSPSGWADANLYANFVPLILLLLSIGYGASCIAGQNEDGTLGFVVILPLSRRRILVQKFLTMSLQGVPVALVTALCVLAGRAFEMPIGIGPLIGVTIGVLLLALDFGALAMFIGALTGSRGLALGITSAIAAASYLLSSLAPVISWLHPFRFLSPFFYAVGDNQLVDTLSIWWALVLVGIAGILLAAALAVFDRLDVH